MKRTMRRTTLSGAGILFLLFAGAVSSHAADATLDLTPGVSFIRFLELPEASSPDSLFGDKLPGGDAWKSSARILTADQPQAQGVYYDSGEHRWRGDLTQLRTGRGYWVVLPQGAGSVQVELAGARVEAGVAPWGSPTGVTISVENGQTVIRPGPPPKSSASYEVVKQPVTSITASSQVYIQQPPGMGGASGAMPGTPMTGGAPWVKVKLDTMWGQGAQEAWVPLAGQGTITVPPPADFDTPPWGDGPVPEGK